MAEYRTQCPCGTLRGTVENGIAVFRGIPYAKTERFREPERIDRWEGCLDATAGELDCWQHSAFYDESDRFYYQEFRRGAQFTYAESPMTLNLITPVNAEKLPVLLFFHGGGFETGTVGELPYGTCTEYAKRGVLFVSAGYRLNVFGLYGGTNYGLADQAACVEWVRRNISAFGGDPERITLAGQSAGAMCLTDLLCSETLRGKISGAVMMSGAGPVPLIAAPIPAEKTASFWRQVDAELGEDPRTAEPERLWQAWESAKNRQRGLYLLRVSQPCVDGVNPPETQRKRLKSGKILDVPMIVGVTSQDFLPPILYGMAYRLGRIADRLGHAPVYGYFFDRTPPGSRYKAFHASDLWYVFGNMDRSWRPFEATDYALSQKMIDAVACFCRTGEPGDPVWKPISARQRKFRLYDGRSDTMVSPRFCLRKLFRSAFKDRGPM